MSEWITSDTGIQSCDPNPNSVATAEASTKSIFKNRPFRGGWGRIGGRGKVCEFRRVGSPGLVGGDTGLLFHSYNVFSLFSPLTTGNNPLEETFHQLEVWDKSGSFSSSRLFFRLVVEWPWEASAIFPCMIEDAEQARTLLGGICANLMQEKS